MVNNTFNTAGLSTIQLYDNQDEILRGISEFTKAKAVAWYYDEIRFYAIINAVWTNEVLKPLENIVRLRLFDATKELHVWRTNGILKGRMRNDSIETSDDYVTSRLVLNGTRFKEAGEGILAGEDRGISYHLPYAELKMAINTDRRIFLETRNYIGYSEIGQAGYVDCRFVDIKL